MSEYQKEKCVKKSAGIKPINTAGKIPRHEARTRPIKPNPPKPRLDSNLHA